MANTLEEAASKTMAAVKAGQAVFQGLVGVFKHLVQEHGEVTALLKRVQLSSDPDVRRRVYPEIRTNLLSHERAELAEVYPILASYEMTRRLATAHQDHARELDARVEEVDKLEFASEEWPRAFERLVQAVEQHVADEEGDYFPRAQDAVGEQEAKAMLHRYEACKRDEVERLQKVV